MNQNLLLVISAALSLALQSCNSRSSMENASSSANGNQSSAAIASSNPSSASASAAPSSSPAADACAPVEGYETLDSCKKNTGAQCAPVSKTIGEQKLICYFSVNGSQNCSEQVSSWEASQWTPWCFYAHNIANSSEYHRYRTVKCNKSNPSCDCAGDEPKELESCTLCSAGSGTVSDAKSAARKTTPSCKTTCPADLNPKVAQCGAEAEPQTTSACSVLKVVELCKNCSIHSEIKELQINQAIYKYLFEKNNTLLMNLGRCGTRLAEQPESIKPAQIIISTQKYSLCKGDQIKGVFSILFKGYRKDIGYVDQSYDTRGECKSILEILEYLMGLDSKECKSTVTQLSK